MKDAGQVADGARVRPYTLVAGRTHAPGPRPLPVETLVVTTEAGLEARLPVERGAILRRCIEPTSVVELSAHLRVPVGVARVLVSDLVAEALVELHLPLVELDIDAPPGRDVLERCLAGLHAL